MAERKILEKSDSKKQRKTAKKQQKLIKLRGKKLKEHVEKQYIENVMPIVDANEQLGIFYMEDGTIVDMFNIITKDLNSAASEELAYDMALWEKLYKTYADDLKIIGLYFHPDTQEQQEYMNELIHRTESPVLSKILQEKKEELAFVETDDVYMEMQFYLLYFAKNKADYKEKCINIYSLLTQGFLPNIEPVDFKWKKKIINQLFNKNMRGGKG